MNTSRDSEIKDTLIVIPARLASTRLPEKMLADICGKPLIVHTLNSVTNAVESQNIPADVVVACDSDAIAKAVQIAGGKAVLTPPDLPSGTDRVYAAYKICDQSHQYKFVINVQGDMPFVQSEVVIEAVQLIRGTAVKSAKQKPYDMSTIASTTDASREDMYRQEQVVNPVISFDDVDEKVGRALYFSRSPIPFGGPFYKHIGIYGFRVETLQRFVNLPQSQLEKSERLEQLRALEDGMTIGIKVLDLECPISVDTAGDLEDARAHCVALNKQH